MANNGKQLEAIVSIVEDSFLPLGCTVSTNVVVKDDDGVQVAEFDVEVRGKLGTGHIAWLIECRDRPASGSAPASWIEQLIGRRQRFHFNKVTAVSTTGFSAGAVACAQEAGIELRTVTALDRASFSDWLQVGELKYVVRTSELRHAGIKVPEHLDPKLGAALRDLFVTCVPADLHLNRSQDSEEVLPSTFFMVF